ncbi:MAG: hypothetical protein A2V67_10615 [Deltaproteobacteria bacterium RBG_13_61_14]|nr:MAG: hypothetical protein A2V67_10615 [Deltaproteobacteria bacterium RBG_13_61_14]
MFRDRGGRGYLLLSANCQPSTANRLWPGVVAALDGVAAEQYGVVAVQDGVVGVQNGGTFEEGISYVVWSMSGRQEREKIEEVGGKWKKW